MQFDGHPIQFITVGGRTSAIDTVTQLKRTNPPKAEAVAAAATKHTPGATAVRRPTTADEPPVMQPAAPSAARRQAKRKRGGAKDEAIPAGTAEASKAASDAGRRRVSRGQTVKAETAAESNLVALPVHARSDGTGTGTGKGKGKGVKGKGKGTRSKSKISVKVNVQTTGSSRLKTAEFKEEGVLDQLDGAVGTRRSVRIRRGGLE